MKCRMFREIYEEGTTKVRVVEHNKDMGRSGWDENSCDKTWTVLRFLETLTRLQIIAITDDGTVTRVYYSEE